MPDPSPSTRVAHTAAGAVAVGPYSHAVDAGIFVVCSGQTPLDSTTGKLVEGDIGAQTRQVFANLWTVLEAARLTPDDVVKANVFLVDMDDYAVMNDVYCDGFGDHRPARSAVAVAALPLGAVVEIEAWSHVPA